MLSDNVLDNGLSYLTTNGDRLDICTTDPATYTEATSTYSLGNAVITIPSPTDRSAGGREVVIPSLSGEDVSADGLAAYWAITNGSDELIATGELSSSQQVYNGNTFDLASFSIGIPDPA
jgi:hypothetical protein